MALESASFINGLSPANPTSTDPVRQGDDHIRLIKATLKNTFPNITGAVTVDQTKVNYLANVTSDIQAQINAASEKPVLTANRALVSDGSGNVSASAVTSAEIGLLSGKDATDWFPSGGIIMWSGSLASIPAGWVLCDGTSGTPDLRGRFIVGAGDGSYAVGDTGGQDTVTLTANQIPSHNHTFSGTTSTAGAHTHTHNDGSVLKASNNNEVSYTASTSNLSGNPSGTTQSTNSSGSHSHTFSGTTSSVGSGQSHENRPPYYALAYIMKV